MRIIAIVEAVLVAGALLAAGPVKAEVPAQPALSHFYPLQPSPGPGTQSDPSSEAQELSEQVSELHDSWDSLTPEQRNQQLAQLQQQVTRLDKDLQNLPPDQRAPVEAMLLPSVIELADLLGKAQSSAPQPCVLFFGPPPCGI